MVDGWVGWIEEMFLTIIGDRWLSMGWWYSIEQSYWEFIIQWISPMNGEWWTIQLVWSFVQINCQGFGMMDDARVNNLGKLLHALKENVGCWWQMIRSEVWGKYCMCQRRMLVVDGRWSAYQWSIFFLNWDRRCKLHFGKIVPQLQEKKEN